MNERIKELRKTLGLTLEKFGGRLGVGKTAISAIENGRRGVTEQMTLSICREYHVNEQWLRTGEGEMFHQSETFSLDDFVRQNDASDLELEILKAYFSLDKDIRTKVVDHFKEALSDKKETAGASTDLLDSIPDTPEEFEAMYPPVEFPKKNAK